LKKKTFGQTNHAGRDLGQVLEGAPSSVYKHLIETFNWISSHTRKLLPQTLAERRKAKKTREAPTLQSYVCYLATLGAHCACMEPLTTINLLRRELCSFMIFITNR